MRPLLILSAFLFVSCAHHKDVRPGPNNQHRVIIVTDNTSAASRDAIAQANHYCEENGEKKAVFIDEQKKYTGDMDEKTYNDAKRVTKVAKTVGGGVWALGGEKESNVGGIVGLGGAAGDAALGDGYTVEMKFSCQ